MMKKLTSLILSLLLCLSLLPGQARADDTPTPVEPPVIVEPVGPAETVDPEEPEPPARPMEGEVPKEADDTHKT